MAISYAEVEALKKELEADYHDRHVALRNLRRYWHGDFWRLADAESHPVATIFRDWTARTSDIGPDIKLVKNVVQQVCVKFQTYLSQLPQIRVFVDPPESDLKRRQSTLKERFVYGCWSEGNQNAMVRDMGWYLPLMGSVYHGCWPNMDRGLPTPIIRSPEYAWPVMSFDGQEENATMFIWKVKESTAIKTFKNYTPPDERFKSSKRLGRLLKRPNDDTADAAGAVEIIEYTDANQWCMYVDGQLERGVEHKFGFNLFEHIKFINVPGEPFGHGAVEQAINLNEMGNALYSILFQSVIENAFPMLVLEDPQKAPEDIEKGPGAILPLNAGGKAYYLNPPTAALPVQEQFLARNEHDIKQAAGLGETEFGQSPASSIVTGKAVDALLGAGSGNTIEMVQGVGIGPGLVAWNEKCIRIGQTVFKDKTMRLYGRETPGTMDLKGRQFALNVKGSELVGSTRNEVVFQVALGQHEKLVMGLQALGGKLVSKKYVREQIGIVDNAHMEEEILVEVVDEAVLGMFAMALQSSATPDQAQQVEEQAAGFLAGETPMVGAVAPHPLLNMGGGAPPTMGGAPGEAQPVAGGSPAPGPPGGGPPGLPAQGPPGMPGLPGGTGFPQGQPPPGGAPAGPGGQPVRLEEAIAAFQQVAVKGRVFLVGEIVARGMTTGMIEVAVTNGSDRTALAAGLPQYQGRLQFHLVTGEPSEQHVEATQGENAGTPGGPQPVAPVAA